VYYLIRMLLIHLYPPDLLYNWTWKIRERKPIIGSSYPMIVWLNALSPINLFPLSLVEPPSLWTWFNLICLILTSFWEWISCTPMELRLTVRILRLFWKMKKGETYSSMGRERKNPIPWFLLWKPVNYYVKGVWDISVMLLIPKQKKRKLKIFL